MIQLKAYKNELIVGLTFLLLVIAFSYKQIQLEKQKIGATSAVASLKEVKDVISLKKIWGNKNISKKVEKLKTLVSPSKIKWHRQGKKLTASFQSIDAQELNRLIVKIMNLPVVIQKLEIHATSAVYQVEFKCKW